MLATGGSASTSVHVLKERGCQGIRFTCLAAAPEGIERLHADHPEIPIVTCAIDRQLNDKAAPSPAWATRVTGFLGGCVT